MEKKNNNSNKNNSSDSYVFDRWPQTKRDSCDWSYPVVSLTLIFRARCLAGVLVLMEADLTEAWEDLPGALPDPDVGQGRAGVMHQLLQRRQETHLRRRRRRRRRRQRQLMASKNVLLWFDLISIFDSKMKLNHLKFIVLYFFPGWFSSTFCFWGSCDEVILRNLIKV